MGRRAKYFTQEERLAARREQSKKRSQTPFTLTGRSKSNRKAYVRRLIKKNCDVTLPSQIEECITWALESTCPDVFDRFRAYQDEVIVVEETELREDALEILSNATTPPSSIVTSVASLGDPNGAWSQISAALLGYQVRKYREDLEARTRQYHLLAIEALSSEVRREFDTCVRQCERLLRAKKRLLEQAEESLFKAVVDQNLRWFAQRARYANEDLAAIMQPEGAEGYLTVVCNRSYDLGRVSL